MARFFRGSGGGHPAVVRPAAQRRNPVCGWPGVVCPEHGFALTATEDWTWCTIPDCGRFWLGSHRAGGCPEPASVFMTNTDGGDRLLCAEHAEHTSRQLAAHQPSTWHDQAG